MRAAPELWWYVARATGVVAWLLAVGSLLVGLALASRALGKQPTAPWLLDLHRWLGGLALWFTGLHLGALVADSFVTFDLVDLLVPFAAPWRPGAVAWGVVAFWLLLAIEVTSLARTRVPKRVWHAVHLSSYVVAVTATVHGLTAGSDTGTSLVTAAVLVSLGGTVFFLVYRQAAPKKPVRTIPARPSRTRSPTEPTSVDPEVQAEAASA